MDQALIDSIVRQVVQTLQRQGQITPAPRQAGPDEQVAKNPPGDDRHSGQRPSNNTSKKGGQGRSPKKAFLTADMLQQRLAMQPERAGAVELAYNEYLTPNAEDLAERRHITITKEVYNPVPSADGAAAIQARTGLAAISSGSALGVVVDGKDEKVFALLNMLAGERLALVNFTKDDCWVENLRSLAGAIRSGSISAGVVIAPYAADAMVIANKLPGIRAVQATRPESVRSAMRRFAANLLVVEHAFTSLHQMKTLVGLFAKRLDIPAAPVMSQYIEKAERI